MTLRRKNHATRRTQLPRKGAKDEQLADFFDRHDAAELLAQGVMELDPDTRDLDRMLQEYWKQPNSQQLNIRVPRGAKHMIEKLARRKTLQVSTLVRMWVIEAMRREAQQP